MIRVLNVLFILLLSACASDVKQILQPSTPVTEPTKLTSNLYGQPKQIVSEKLSKVAVLLPFSGANAELGNSIARSIEMASFQTKTPNIEFSFYDIGGEAKFENIQQVKSLNPDLILGPVFSSDVELVRDIIPDVPMISFSSNPDILNSNTWTMALLPNHQIERILSVAKNQGKKRFVIVAPDNKSGYIMANSAKTSANILDMDIVGLYYYEEGNRDEIKNIAMKISNYENRKNANTKAKELLAENLASPNSDILEMDRYKLKLQLDELSKKDTLGNLPYDSILLLGEGTDLSTLNSYLRFYDISSDILRMGTAMWGTEEIVNDTIFVNGIYPNLPFQNSDFVNIYEAMEQQEPTRMASMGYDATMIAINSLKSGNLASNLISNSGFLGIDGIIRFKSNGLSERGLSVLTITPYGLKEISMAPTTFIGYSYKSVSDSSKPRAFDIEDTDIDISKYIILPKNVPVTKLKTYETSVDDEVMNYEQDDENVVQTDFVPNEVETVDQQLLDNIEIKLKKTKKR